MDYRPRRRQPNNTNMMQGGIGPRSVVLYAITNFAAHAHALISAEPGADPRADADVSADLNADVGALSLDVGMPPTFTHRNTGGQRQRGGAARVTGPRPHHSQVSVLLVSISASPSEVTFDLKAATNVNDHVYEHIEPSLQSLGWVHP